MSDTAPPARFLSVTRLHRPPRQSPRIQTLLIYHGSATVRIPSTTSSFSASFSPLVPQPPWSRSCPPSFHLRHSRRRRLRRRTPTKPQIPPIVPDPLRKRYRRPRRLPVLAHQLHPQERALDCIVGAELEGVCYLREALAASPFQLSWSGLQLPLLGESYIRVGLGQGGWADSQVWLGSRGWNWGVRSGCEVRGTYRRDR